MTAIEVVERWNRATGKWEHHRQQEVKVTRAGRWLKVRGLTFDNNGKECRSDHYPGRDYRHRLENIQK